MNDSKKDPLVIVAIGAAIGLAGWGILAGLAQLAPALGVMVSLATTGAAAGFTVGPALGTVAAYGAATTGAALSVQLGVKIMREARKEPLLWGTPVLGVVSGFLVQLCEELWKGPRAVWLAFSVAVSLLVVVGGVFYSTRMPAAKWIGGVCTLVAPAALLAATARYEPEALRQFFTVDSMSMWLPVVMLLVVALILARLAHVTEKKS